MKNIKFLLFLTIILFATKNVAQTQFTVTYSRTNKASDLNDYETLLFKNNSAVFEFYQKKEKKEVDFYEVSILFIKFTSIYDIKTKNIKEQQQLEDGTLCFAEWKHEIKWDILEDTKIINGYTVQKATTNSYNPKEEEFGYGKVTAWFTTEIPIGIGPFRYYGLPGLILELSYEHYGDTYRMTKIDFDTPITIPTIEKGIVISKEQSLSPHTISKKWLKKQKKSMF